MFIPHFHLNIFQCLLFMLENIGSKTRFDLSNSHVHTLRHVNTDCSQHKKSLFGITSAFTSKILEKSRGRYSIACHIILNFWETWTHYFLQCLLTPLLYSHHSKIVPHTHRLWNKNWSGETEQRNCSTKMRWRSRKCMVQVEIGRAPVIHTTMFSTCWSQRTWLCASWKTLRRPRLSPL